MTPNLSYDATMSDAVCVPDAGSSSQAASWQNANPTIMTRVDAPHETAPSARGSPADEPAPATSFVHDESLSEQVSLQAAQLATHLRSRQRG